MRIEFTYGKAQAFRYRTHDINVLGRVEDVVYPLRKSAWSLNGGPETFVYVEHIADPGIDWTYEYKDSPSVNRLKDLGDFNIEIPVAGADLRSGDNLLTLRIKDASGAEGSAEVRFTFDEIPLDADLDLTDLSRFSHIQQVGQITNGAFDLDREQNLIRSRAPVYVDAFIVLGSLHGSQRATYDVRFTDLTKVKWIGPSDFFAGHAGPKPPIGIKPGWSSAGLVALNPRNEARMFLAFGDHVGTDQEWVVQTMPFVRFYPRERIWYSAKHDVIFRDGINSSRFKIWPRGEAEPEEWLLQESDADIAPGLPRYERASFGLFQHSGMPNEWANIVLTPLEK